MSPRPVIAVTMGDPLGIGPEVLVKALADTALRSRARFRVYGIAAALDAAAREASLAPFWEIAPAPSRPEASAPSADVTLLDYRDFAGALRSPTRGPTREGGAASFRFVEDAIAAAAPPARPEHADAIVTAPISKEAWSLAGHTKYPGHTDLLAERFKARRVRMMFVAPRLRVILATGHTPIAGVPEALTIERVADTIELGHEACRRLVVADPRIAVCGLNPHAGERGLIGKEDELIIRPAIEQARTKGINAAGPFPGDTIFNAALEGRYDLVVAMYHDQGLIPVKLLAFQSAVNVTVGLPTVRTSPDHGTAFDRAGTNSAEAGSMSAAIDLAIRLARSQPAAPARA